MVLTLEAFDDSNLSMQSAKAAPSADFLAGFAAGEAAKQDFFDQDQRTLKEELLQQVADMTFGYEEAFAQIAASLGPLFDTVLSKLLPAVLDRSLAGTLHDMLLQAAQTDAAQPVTIHVHPDQSVAIQDALSGINHAHLNIVSNAEMTRHASLVQTANGETSFDLDAALSEISTIFNAMPHAQDRSQ
jgi:flagellar biosynthesis/type III secretory pathway protein FliH